MNHTEFCSRLVFGNQASTMSALDESDSVVLVQYGFGLRCLSAPETGQKEYEQ